MITIDRLIMIYLISFTFDHPVLLCLQDWPSQAFILVFTFLSIALQYIMPSCIVALSYMKIYSVFRASTRKIGTQLVSSRMMGNARRRKRTNIILSLLSGVFFLSWAPLNIFAKSHCHIKKATQHDNWKDTHTTQADYPSRW